MPINEPSLSLRGRQISINKTTSGNILKSSKANSKSTSCSSRKGGHASNSSPSNSPYDSCSPVSSASSTSSSSSREPLILRGAKKKKSLLLSATNYKEEAVIGNGKNAHIISRGNSKHNIVGSSCKSVIQIQHQRPKHKKGKYGVRDYENLIANMIYIGKISV